MIRSWVERMSRGVVLKRRLPKRVGGGSMYVSPDAALRYWRWNMEKTARTLFDLAIKIVKPGDFIWDIGANVGMFSFPSAYLAGRNGRVLSLEPDAFLASLLQRSAAIASPQSAPVDVLIAAASDTVGLARFNIARKGRGSNHLAGVGRVISGGTRATTLSTTITLDWLMDQFGTPTLVKIDVEGAEHLVMRGAGRLLTTARPTIVCEVGRDHAAEIEGILTAANYRVTDLDVERGEAVSQTRSFWDILARPAESTP